MPLRGVDPVHMVLATRAGDNRWLTAAFRGCADATLTSPERTVVDPVARKVR